MGNASIDLLCLGTARVEKFGKQNKDQKSLTSDFLIMPVLSIIESNLDIEGQ